MDSHRLHGPRVEVPLPVRTLLQSLPLLTSPKLRQGEQEIRPLPQRSAKTLGKNDDKHPGELLNLRCHRRKTWWRRSDICPGWSGPTATGSPRYAARSVSNKWALITIGWTNAKFRPSNIPNPSPTASASFQPNKTSAPTET